MRSDADRPHSMSEIETRIYVECQRIHRESEYMGNRLRVRVCMGNGLSQRVCVWEIDSLTESESVYMGNRLSHLV